MNRFVDIFDAGSGALAGQVRRPANLAHSGRPGTRVLHPCCLCLHIKRFGHRVCLSAAARGQRLSRQLPSVCSANLPAAAHFWIPHSAAEQPLHDGHPLAKRCAPAPAGAGGCNQQRAHPHLPVKEAAGPDLIGQSSACCQLRPPTCVDECRTTMHPPLPCCLSFVMAAAGLHDLDYANSCIHLRPPLLLCM